MRNISKIALGFFVAFSGSAAVAQSDLAATILSDYGIQVDENEIDSETAICLKEYTITDRIACLDRANTNTNRVSLFIIADHYWRGLGVEQNYGISRDYLQISAELGYRYSYDALAKISALGLYGARDLAEANRLRAKAAKTINAALEPMWIEGDIKPSNYRDCQYHMDCAYIAEKITVAVDVSADGAPLACSAEGENEVFKKDTCKNIMKYFKFLPALNNKGDPIIRVFKTSVTRPPLRENSKTQAKLLSGSLSADNYPKKLAESFGSSLILSINLIIDRFGRVKNCGVEGAASNIKLITCNHIRKTFKFAPAQHRSGKATEGTYTSIFEIDFGNEGLQP